MSGTRKMEKFEVDAIGDRATPLVDLPARPFAPAEIPTPAEQWSPEEFVPPQRAGSDAPAPATDADALRTQLARKFISLAESFTQAFRASPVGGGSYAVELTAPQGMSTGGGKQALQHIHLRPLRPGPPALVAGTVNQVHGRAELRDFDHMSMVHDVRFRRRFSFTPEDWEQFLRQAESVLNASGIQSMRLPPPRELLNQHRASQRVSKGALALLLVVLFFAAVVAWRVVAVLQSQP